MIDHKKLAAALKTLDAAPKAIELAKEKYQQDMANIRANEATGRYAPVTIEKAKREAKEERDRKIKALAESMKTALVEVKRNNSYETEPLALDDPKLTNALSVIGIMGKNMPLNTQINMLNQFRGNPAALAVLEGAYKQNGLYFHDMAHDMQQPIKQQAIEEMERVFAYYDYNLATKGVVDVDMKHAFWTKNQFAEQAKRLGYNLDEESDPYEYAISEMRRKLDEDTFSPDDATRAAVQAKKWELDIALQNLKAAKQTGADEGAVFNKAIQRFQSFTQSADVAGTAEGNA